MREGRFKVVLKINHSASIQKARIFALFVMGAKRTKCDHAENYSSD